ncbi:pilus assembly PilX family protein [Desulfopila aestuarii]|uniref:PilX N-terminal n=1 Tax=Desulfopila aestuarii DSM 18488 TaxID=1121416 RepID=A0A1M7Y1N2_9BACT|nr:pilus assembly PilX N-terminal domain-containing protein [Desulfopila aestuarii]SHO45682.1 PilX N-terminal [Desulfopila aestuarii DSM 18488]
MNKKCHGRLIKDDGFVLVTALLVMLILTIIGITATTNTSLELRIAGNDKLHKQTFYTAEGGAILGAEILEQNLNCVTGFASSPINGNITINTLDMAFNSYGDADYSSKATIAQTIMDNAKADFVFPIAGAEQSFGYVVGETRMQPGGTLVMAAGYERKGKSAASGGVSLHYDVYSRHLGKDDSESIVLLGWRHLVGDESACVY